MLFLYCLIFVRNHLASCVSSSIKNIDVKVKANDFVCIDNTKFKHFVDPTTFFVKSCAVPGMCFTRKPPAKNPCIGKERALEIDK